MATIVINQEREKVISPNLEDTVSSERGVYYIQHKWVVDSTTLQPVGVQNSVSFPS